jgi:glucosamine--fructose-6-phosphate aminotransferase (isomerizing)
LAVPSLFTLYKRPPALDGALVMGISQYGQSPDIVAVIEEARNQGALTLAITNDIESPLGKTAELCLPVLAGEERAVAATKTYTGELMAIGMISAALESNGSRWQELEVVPDAVQAVLSLNAAMIETVAPLKQAMRFLVLGRGFNYSTAFEVALKIKETSYVVAEPYSSADLLHGPIALVDAGFPVILIAPSGELVEELRSLLDLLSKRQAELLVISDRPEFLARGRAWRLPEGVAEWVSPMVAVVPGQLFALGMALAHGFDPDAPRGLSKITRTR